MTLRDKFEGGFRDKKLNAKYCEQIADDYAIEFSEFVLLRHYLKLVKKDTTLKDLLEIFKKEKGL